MKGLPNAMRSARPSAMALFAWLIKAIVGYDEPAEQTFEVFVVERRNREAGRIAFNNMEIGEALFRQLFCNVVQ